MTLVRTDIRIDVTEALPADAQSEPTTVVGTVVVDPDVLRTDPVVVFATPGGTYSRRYWDLQPPGSTGYSQAEWVAARGDVLIALDYLGGGDSSRPSDGDFMTLEVCADAAHSVFQQLSAKLANATLVDGLPALTKPTYVGFGQSLGAFITMIQQGKYADYAGIAVLGASPRVIANIPFHRDLVDVPMAERRELIMIDNAKSAGLDELPPYHSAPRRLYAGIFHVADVPDDLLDYDEAECEVLISRVTGVDGMTPGYAKQWADEVEGPVFVAFGDSDVSSDPGSRRLGIRSHDTSRWRRSPTWRTCTTSPTRASSSGRRSTAGFRGTSSNSGSVG